MVYIAYFTELNSKIWDYAQKQRICRENCKYALDERFHGHFCPRRKPAKSCHPALDPLHPPLSLMDIFMHFWFWKYKLKKTFLLRQLQSSHPPFIGKCQKKINLFCLNSVICSHLDLSVEIMTMNRKLFHILAMLAGCSFHWQSLRWVTSAIGGWDGQTMLLGDLFFPSEG